MAGVVSRGASRMASAERMGRASLRSDALYCAAAGCGAAALSRRLGEVLDIPRPAVLAGGIAALGWAAVVRSLAGRGGWRAATRGVLTANVVASLGLAAWSLTQRHRSARVLLAATSLQVAGFAAWQATALMRDVAG